MSRAHNAEPGNSEVEALLMDDLTVKESTLDAAYKKEPQSLLQQTQRVFGKILQVARRGRTTPSSPRTPGSTIRAIFNYPEPDLRPRETAWLDGLRGIAALEVFVFHYLDQWLEKGLAWGDGRYRDSSWFRLPFIRTFYASGDTAVCVFFAISGYVLTYRMLGLIRQRRLEDFYTVLSSAVFRRGIRLYMPVIIETFTLMFLGRYFGLPKPGGWENEPSFLLELKRWFTQLVHLFLPLRYPDRWDEILNLYDGTISWTIPLEYYGSLLVYVVLLLFSRTNSLRLRLGIIAGLVVNGFMKDDWIGAQFLLGMGFADYQLEKRKPASQHIERLRSAFFWGVFIFGFYLAGLPGGHYVDEQAKYRLWSRPFYDWITQPLAAIGLYAHRQVDRYIECFAGLCIVVGVGETERLKRLTDARFVQYLGKISFGLYLCHIFIHSWLKPLDPFWMAFMRVDSTVLPHLRQPSLNYFLAYVLMMSFAVVINFIAAGLFQRYVDGPSIQMAKSFEKWCLAVGRDDHLPQQSLQNGNAS